MTMSISPDVHIALIQQERQREAEAFRLADLAREYAKAQRHTVVRENNRKEFD